MPDEVFGYDAITWQYYDRYHLPVMHTETNTMQGSNGNEAVYWLWKEWAEDRRVEAEQKREETPTEPAETSGGR